MMSRPTFLGNLFVPGDDVLRLPLPITQVKAEFEALLNYLPNPRIIIEIGSFFGGSTIAFGHTFPWAHVIAVDDFVGVQNTSFPLEGFEEALPSVPTPTSLEKLWREMSGNPKIQLVHGSSHVPMTQMLTAVKTSVNNADGLFRAADVLFIDGDHSYEGVKFDFKTYSQLVRPGGIVALHDIRNHPDVPENDVERFWNEIKETYSDTFEFVSDPTQVGYGIGAVVMPG